MVERRGTEDASLRAKSVQPKYTQPERYQTFNLPLGRFWNTRKVQMETVHCVSLAVVWFEMSRLFANRRLAEFAEVRASQMNV